MSFLNARSTYNFTKDNVAEFNDVVDTLFSKLEMTGLSIIITKDGKLIYEYNKGYKTLPSERYPGQLLKTGDLFRIASISKTFVATIVIKLVEENKISLEDEAQKYLDFSLRNPYFPNIPITIDMLLTHSSTITDDQGYKNLEIINPKVNKNFKDSYLNGPPGKRFKYSNLNFNILGAIIEKVTNKRFDIVANDYIFHPLKLNGSFNPLDLDSSKFVSLYTFNKDKQTYTISENAYYLDNQKLNNYILGKSTGILSPCGGVKISALDLAKYMHMHMNHGITDTMQIIKREGEILLRSIHPWIKKNYGHSISTYSNIIEKKIFLGQTGGAYGLKSAMLFDPQEKLGFIIISNGNKSLFPSGIEDIHKPVIKSFYNFFYKD